MVHVAVSDWIRLSGLKKTYVSAVSGVSRSSINRIEKGESDPNLGTLRELAMACGFDLDLSIKPLADPFAAQAVRSLLEDDFLPDDARAVAEWITRIEKTGLQDPLAMVEYAGRASGLRALGSRGIYLRGEASVLRLASAADAANAPWAVSGSPHLQLATDHEVSGPHIIWTQEPQLVADLLGDSLLKARAVETASVIIALAPPALFQNSFVVRGVKYVAPIQAIIDGFSLGGRCAEVASDIARSW